MMTTAIPDQYRVTWYQTLIVTAKEDDPERIAAMDDIHAAADLRHALVQAIEQFAKINGDDFTADELADVIARACADLPASVDNRIRNE
jgi:hypothetical protein